MENYRLEQTGQEVQNILNGAAMQTDLTAEVERAEAAEQALGGAIDDEELRAKAAEETLDGAIGDEELRAKAAEEQNANGIAAINAKIPAGASSENKLADVDFVNSSIETATATFRGSYNLVSDLHLAVDATHAQIATLLGTVIAEADNNDYSYVLVPTSAQTPTEIAAIEKYTYGANGWAFAYALNNSGFTSAQWAAINSGITSGLVAKLTALPTNADLLLLLAGKQDVLTFDDVPVEGSTNPVKSGGVHSAIDDEKTARVNAMNQLSGRVDTIEGEIPAQASSENQLADKAYVNSSISTNTATYRGSFNLVADLGLSVSATHEQIGTALAGEIATADNNDYAFVQVPTSDETPAQILKVERYKFNGTAWVFEYELNNSGFTAAQWAALNSGITSGLVAKLMALPTNDELVLALAGKQDVLTFDNTPTENSNNPVKSGGVYAADKALSDAIEAILLLIPSAATSLNKLVDTDLMNSSISTATATFRGTFNLVSDLSLDLTATHAQIATALAGEIATADNNDYTFVLVPTSVGTPTEIAQTDRYKFNGTAWAFEYTLNNSGFTAAQWAAINSAITTELVAKLTALPTNAELLESLGLLSSGISGINAKIPSAASSENKLVDGTAMETYVAQIVGAIDATFNVTSTDGHVTLAITQVNGVITSVQLTTTDIASAAALNLKASQADLTALAGRVTTAEGNITSLTGRMTTAESDIDTLTNLYNALQQSAPQVIQPTDTWPVANPSTTVIYRVIDRVNTPPEYYSDYMWNGTSMVLMATYNNAVDTTPKKDSANLITSGGVFANIGAFDISEYHKSGSTLATYADLTAALAAIPSDYQKGGMSIKFVQSSDNNYVRFFLTKNQWSTTVSDWQGVDEEPAAGSRNLIESGGVYAHTENQIDTAFSNITGIHTKDVVDFYNATLLSLRGGASIASKDIVSITTGGAVERVNIIFSIQQNLKYKIEHYIVVGNTVEFGVKFVEEMPSELSTNGFDFVNTEFESNNNNYCVLYFGLGSSKFSQVAASVYELPTETILQSIEQLNDTTKKTADILKIYKHVTEGITNNTFINQQGQQMSYTTEQNRFASTGFIELPQDVKFRVKNMTEGLASFVIYGGDKGVQRVITSSYTGEYIDFVLRGAEKYIRTTILADVQPDISYLDVLYNENPVSLVVSKCDSPQYDNLLILFDNIVCIGDSLTYGHVRITPSSSRQAILPYPDAIKKICNMQSSQIIAQSGASAKALWNSYSSQLVAKSNAVAMIYLGCNQGLTDTFNTDVTSHEDYADYANTNTGCYGKWIAKAKELGFKVLLIRPYAVGDGGDLAVTNNVIEQAASYFNVAFIDAPYNLSPEYFYYANISQGVNGDDVHYNDIGYVWFANEVINRVSELGDSLKYFLTPNP